MNNKQLSVGDYIDSLCTKCRMLTNHTIVAMVGEKVVKVECRTCSGIHNYRPQRPKAVSAPARTSKPAASRGASRTAAAKAVEIEGIRVAVEAGERQARPYDMNAAYRTDDVLSHPVFGIGVVKSTCKPNKMEVLFADGEKRLRCRL